MPSQGPLITATWFTDLSGTVQWINPPDAEFSDDIYSTATLNSDDFTDNLTGQVFGATIPLSATITGFVMSVEDKSSTGSALDIGVHLRKFGPVFSANRAHSAPISAIESVTTYGGAADLWGLTWTPAEVNNAATGVAFAVGSLADGEVCSVDQITLTVFFTLGGQPMWMMLGVGHPQ